MTTPVHVFPRIYERQRRPSSRNDADSRNAFKRTKQQMVKFGAWVFFGLGIMFLSKNFFYGIDIGIAELIFCIVLVICLLLWGLISFCEALGYYFPNPPVAENCNGYVREQLTPSRQPVGISISENPSDIPPPYNMVATLSPNNNKQVMSILESPPPSYDKVSPDK